MRNLSVERKDSWLTWMMRGLLFLSLLVLLGRAYELQIIKGSYYSDLANGNRIRRVPIAAPRGEILARGGEVYVSNTQVKRRIEFDPKIGYEKLSSLENASPDEIITEYNRNYLYGADFAHISGYVGEANQDEVNKVDPDCPEKGPRRIGLLVGRGGLEQEYECRLRGIDGEELIEVDSMGRKVRTIGRRNPIPGESIITTIDLHLQKKIAAAMKEKDGKVVKKGGVIVTDGKGQVLGLYSSPSFDPNNVSLSLDDPGLPFFNRVIGGTYHPGSVFKLVTAAAALEDGKIDKNFTYDDPGIIRVNDFSYSNWYFSQYGKTEGVINLVKGIARSTDTMFYKLGEMVGVDRLSYWANKFGLEKKTGIDLPGEVAGLIPTPAWKSQQKGESWFLGNTYHMAIGQGDVSITLAEANSETSVISSNGLLCNLHILQVKNSDCSDIGLSKETLSLIKEGMIGVCSEGGTAFPFFDWNNKSGLSPHPDWPGQVACKTGTAETGERDVSHAWFTAFAPSDSPEIVVTVIVEKGGEGSSVAAPIAKDIMSYWFSKNK